MARQVEVATELPMVTTERGGLRAHGCPRVFEEAPSCTTCPAKRGWVVRCAHERFQGERGSSDANWYSPWGCGVWGEGARREDVREVKKPTEREKRDAADTLVMRMVAEGSIRGEAEEMATYYHTARSLLDAGAIVIEKHA